MTTHIQELEAQLIITQVELEQAQAAFKVASAALDEKVEAHNVATQKVILAKIDLMRQTNIIDWEFLLHVDHRRLTLHALRDKLHEVFPQRWVTQDGYDDKSKQYNIELALNESSKDRLDEINEFIQPILTAIKPITMDRVYESPRSSMYHPLTGKYIQIAGETYDDYPSVYALGNDTGWHLIHHRGYHQYINKSFPTFREFLTYVQEEFAASEENE